MIQWEADKMSNIEYFHGQYYHNHLHSKFIHNYQIIRTIDEFSIREKDRFFNNVRFYLIIDHECIKLFWLFVKKLLIFWILTEHG